MTSEPLRRSNGKQFYAQIPDALISSSTTATEWLVYAWLDRRIGSTRSCWHDSSRGIAAAVGVSHASVNRALRLLADKGLVISTHAEDRTQCIALTEREWNTSVPLRGHEWNTSVPRVEHQRSTRADRTLLGSEKPSGKPKSTHARKTDRKATAHDRVVVRDWPAVQRRLGL